MQGNKVLQMLVLSVVISGASAIAATNTWTILGSSTPYTNYPTGTNGTTTQERVGIGTNAAVSSQLYVVSQATGLIPFIVNTPASPTVDIAQFQLSGATKFVINNSGNVGVGITPASDVLDVRMSSSVNQAGLTISGPTTSGNGSQPAVVFKRYSGTTLTTVSKVYSNNGDILFTTGTGTSPSDRMIIDNAGRVGIGTTTPGTNYKLDVSGVFHVINGNQALFSNSGTAALPSISFDNDQNTGIINPSNADNLGFVTNGSERMRIDQVGNVGIGMSPATGYKLDVNGHVHVADGSQLILSKTANAGLPSIAFDANNNSGIFSPSDDILALSTGSQERMRIDANGHVGIGTTTPGNGQNYSLHVNGPTLITTGPLVVNDGVQAKFSNTSTAGTPSISFNTNTNMGIFPTGNALAFSTGASERMRIDANGLVGIGNVPTKKLTVTGGIKADTLIATTIVGTLTSGSVPWSMITGMPMYTDGSNVGVGTTATLNQKLVVNGGNAKIMGATWGSNGNTATMYLGDENHYIRAIYGSGVRIGTANAADAITIAQTTGDVAITKGNLNVTNGKINVKGWSIEEAPDYVFEKDYKLAKLNDVESFVKDHKHLPDMPSAKEINKKGIDLTEMNMTLLKKVEELTLYTIDQNKKLQAQNMKILEQNKRIDALEKKVSK
jgi:hypothetical protein